MRLAFFSLAIFLMLPGPIVRAQTAAPSSLLRKLVDVPAPAPFDPPEKKVEAKERPADFMDEENVPPDDAPIEDLLDYWTQPYANLFPTTYRPTPSKKTVERILEHCEDNPEKLPRYLGIFPPKPDIADTIKDIYDKETSKSGQENYEFTRVKEWLKFNSRFYIEDLKKSANEIRDENNYVQNANQHVLRALAKVDWDAALPIIQRLENDHSNPHSVILAKWVSYQHARDTGDFATENAYRHDLQKIVENTTATWAQRDLAMDALVIEGDFEGRDEWYLSLLDDETLLKIQDNGYTGLTTLMNASPRKQWLERMVELAESTNLSVRTAAARNLMRMYKEGKPEVLKALVPWLMNPGWAKESRNGERSALIKALGDTLVPEGVPGLIAIVMNEEENRDAAATALVKYKDPRAVPALRSILATKESPGDRNTFIAALVASGGFSGEEQMADLEAYAVMISTPEGQELIDSYETYYNEEDGHGEEEEETAAAKAKPVIPMQISIGKFLADQEEPPESLVVRAMARVKILSRTNPAVAATLSEIMAKWKGKAVYIELLRRIRSGESDIAGIITLLANRAAVRDGLPGEIAALRAALGIPRGIANCITEEPAEYLAILGQTDEDAQTAMLGCARLVRAPLPLSEVGELLGSPNKLLAMAAERYLESEDSLEARKLVLARNKGAAKILGARTAFIPDVKSVYDSPALSELFTSVSGEYFRTGKAAELAKREDALRKELADDPSMLAVYALLTPADSGHYVVRLYEDRAVFTYYENEARYQDRTLTPKEYEAFYDFLIQNNIDAVKPDIGICEHQCYPGEFVMFGRDGGRRVYYESTPSNPKLEKLQEILAEFNKGKLKLHYRLGSGLEVLLADDESPVRAVWKKAEDLRVVVEGAVPAETGSEVPPPGDEGAASLSWRKFENGKLGGPVVQPVETPFLRDEKQAPEMAGINSTPRAWQVRTPSGEIRASEYEDPGLFRVVRGHEPVKIKEGNYQNPIVTGDGKWVIVSKANEESGEYNRIVRINLLTRREFPINLPPADSVRPAAFVYSHNKVLVYRGKLPAYEYEEGEGEGEEEGDAPPRPARPDLTPAIPEYYLVDAATGAVQRVRGEVRPLELQTYRPLQPTGVPSEFWAAVYDENTKSTSIGRYSDKTFTFRAVMNVPNINLDSMAIWVDEPGRKVYFVYEGHLLALPMK
jgi:hypothetical protein